MPSRVRIFVVEDHSDEFRTHVFGLSDGTLTSIHSRMRKFTQARFFAAELSGLFHSSCRIGHTVGGRWAYTLKVESHTFRRARHGRRSCAARHSRTSWFSTISEESQVKEK
jgi:hypothetical protein